MEVVDWHRGDDPLPTKTLRMGIDRNGNPCQKLSCRNWTLTMAKKDDLERAELERLNAQLTDSLERCRRILADYQSRLAANTNEPSDPVEEHRRDQA